MYKLWSYNNLIVFYYKSSRKQARFLTRMWYMWCTCESRIATRQNKVKKKKKLKYKLNSFINLSISSFRFNRKKRKRKQTKFEKKIRERERCRHQKETFSPKTLEQLRIERNRRKAESIARETPEERNLRLYKLRIHKAKTRRSLSDEERKRINALAQQRQREKQNMNETPEERKERLAKHAQRTAELRKARKAAQSKSAGCTSTSSEQLLTSRSSLPRVAKQRCTLNFSSITFYYHLNMWKTWSS